MPSSCFRYSLLLTTVYEPPAVSWDSLQHQFDWNVHTQCGRSSVQRRRSGSARLTKDARRQADKTLSPPGCAVLCVGGAPLSDVALQCCCLLTDRPEVRHPPRDVVTVVINRSNESTEWTHKLPRPDQAMGVPSPFPLTEFV